LRSIEILLRKDFEVKIVSLPQGEDPDSFVNKFGKDDFEELVKKADNFLEYETRYYESQGKFNDPATAAEAIRDLVKPLALMNDELKRNLLIKDIAKKFNLREKLLETELDKHIKQFKKFENTESRQLQKRKSEEAAAKIPSAVSEASSALYSLEQEILRILFEADKPSAELIFSFLQPEDFAVDLNRELFEILKEEFENDSVREGFKSRDLISILKDETQEAYARELTFDKYSVSSSWEERFPSITSDKIILKRTKDTLQKFISERIDKEIQSNRREIELTEDESKLLELMRANNELEEEKKRIREELTAEN
jgi:DNA primase